MEYLYNVSGQRVSTWNGSTRTAVSGKYYWDSTPVGFYTVGGSTYFEHQNWVGTERAVTSYNGGVIATIASLPFGDGRTVSGTDPDAYDFAGLDYDAESNLDHASYRQLATAQGRWLTPDPYNGSYNFSNPQTLNRYAYALNSPVSLTDPSGLECVWDDGSYDSAGDPDDINGESEDNAGECRDKGGTWVDHQYFVDNGLADWSSKSDPTLADFTDQTYVVTAQPLPPLTLILSVSQSPGSQQNQGGGFAPSNGTPKPQQPQQNPQPPKKPWFCGTGNSWSHPFTAPTSRQWGIWASSDAIVSSSIAKFTKGTDPFSQAFYWSALLEGYGWAACGD